MSTINKNSTESKKRGSNLTPSSRGTYYNSDSHSKKVKDGIESYRVYLSAKGIFQPSRGQIEAIRFFAAPFVREERK